MGGQPGGQPKFWEAMAPRLHAETPLSRKKPECIDDHSRTCTSSAVVQWVPQWSMKETTLNLAILTIFLHSVVRSVVFYRTNAANWNLVIITKRFLLICIIIRIQKRHVYLWLWTYGLTFERDLDRVETNQRAKYLCWRSCSKKRQTDTHWTDHSTWATEDINIFKEVA